jgi:hypothetical protein
MGLHEIKKLLYNKRNGIVIEEVTHGMGEHLCKLCIRQGTENQNIQGAQKTKLPPNQRPNKEIELFQKKKSKWLKNT